MSISQNERNQIFQDLYTGKRPSRIPVTLTMNIEATMEYFGYSILRDIYSPEKCYEVADRTAEILDSDLLPVSPASTPAAVFRYIGSKFMTPGKDGFFQHPDIAPMELDEYPEFNKDPFKFIVTKIQPRIYKIFDEQPELAHLRIKVAREVVKNQYLGMGAKLADKHERANVIKPSGLLLHAPFDFIADYIRSFSTILVDIRRKPQWVLEACEGALEYQIKQLENLPDLEPAVISEVFLPLHMAPYMRTKDVEKFYWPTYKKLIMAIQKKGYVPSIFYENNWGPHLDLLEDLPGMHVAKFESAPIELIAKKVPKRNIIAGVYPFSVIRTGTKQQCIDEAKKIIDILGPSGNFILNPNKRFIRGGDLNIENIQTVIEFVKEYGRY